MSGNTVTKFFIDQLTEGQLTWAPLDPQHDEVIIGTGPEDARRFPIMSDFKAYRDALLDKFPGEKVAIDKYMELLKVFINSVTKPLLSAMCIITLWVTVLLFPFEKSFWEIMLSAHVLYAYDHGR